MARRHHRPHLLLLLLLLRQRRQRRQLGSASLLVALRLQCCPATLAVIHVGDASQVRLQRGH
jgi:hypothetical protein